MNTIENVMLKQEQEQIQKAKQKKKRQMELIVLISAIALIILGIVSIITGAIIQQIVIYRKIGIILGDAIIPHWSLFLYLGFIPSSVGYFLIKNKL